MPSRNPADLLAEWRAAGPGRRHGILCIVAAILTGVVGLAGVENGSIGVLPVAMVIVALIVAAAVFHMRDERRG